ncbi:hypothetical protein AcidC75_16600 [Acidisoma sp. C75]
MPKALFRPSSPCKTAGLSDRTRKLLGITPSCFCTAANMGCEAAGAVSNVGTVMRDMGLSVIEPPFAVWLNLDL